MRVIIAGGRDVGDYAIVEAAMVSALCSEGITPTIVVSGAARGADRLGEKWAAEKGVPIARHPANWDLHGKKAGYVRNMVMANNAEALVALWDGKSKGTGHMIDLAKKAGLKVFVWRVDERGLQSRWAAETI